MKSPYLSLFITILTLTVSAVAEEKIPNRLIDYDGFLQIVASSKESRETNRLTEADFISAMESGKYILLDARSKVNYDLRHIKGAINLPFTEFSEKSLADIIKNKESRILIYCNNNFTGSPVAMVSKSASASLNLSTQASLRAYGYLNIYELGPLLDVKTSKIPFLGAEVK
jgi:rhodanese-related sulfurtransferase